MTGSRRTRWMGLLALLAVLSVLPARARPEDDTTSVLWEDCQEMIVFQEVKMTDVDRFLPPDFEEKGFALSPQTDPGNAGLFFTARRCARMRVEGKARENTIDAHISVAVNSRPESRGFFGADTDHTRLGVFMLQYVSDNPDFIAWLRRDTGLEDVARLVDDMAFDYEPSNGVDPGFLFWQGSPARSPARVQGIRPEPAATSAGFPLVEDFWGITSRGIVHLIADPRRATVGGFGEMTYTLRAEPGSPLHEMLDPVAPLFEPQGTRTTSDPIGAASFDLMSFDKCIHSAHNSSCTGGWD